MGDLVVVVMVGGGSRLEVTHGARGLGDLIQGEGQGENIGWKPVEHELLRGRQSKKSLGSKTPGALGQRFWRKLRSQRKGTFSN